MLTRQSKTQGFTLLEIMVVLVIVAIITAVAVIAFRHFGQGERQGIVAQQLAQTIKTAEEQAMLQPAVLGMRITRKGYQFYRYRINAAKKEASWAPLLEVAGLSAPDAFRGVVVSFKGKKVSLNAKQKHFVQIVFIPSGDATPAALSIQGMGRAPSIVTIQENGNVSIETKGLHAH